MQPHTQILSDYQITRIVEKAVQQIEANVFGKHLLKRFPVIITTPTYHAKEHAVLAKYGSPACTDGKMVYVSATEMRNILEMPAHKWDTRSVVASNELAWRDMKMSEEEIVIANDTAKCVEEARDIILHELTHALNEHCKLQRRYAKTASKLYQQKLDVACELQANDGIIGRKYMYNYTQQHPGVTNKRKHPECINYHTLREFMEHVELTPEEQMQGAMSAASRNAKASQELAETTGAAEEYDREMQDSGKDKEQDKGQEEVGGAFRENEQDTMQDSDAKLAAEIQKLGLQHLKELILATLSDELKYDPLTDSVIYNNVRKRIAQRTYSRPCKRGNLQLSPTTMIVRKGRKVNREIVRNKTRDLTILAVDASGSMDGQAQYVSAILDNLLKQTEEIAKEYDIEINYDNMQALQHTTRTTRPVAVTSNEWKRQMQNYEACGGNDFDCVLRRVNEMLDAKEYETVNIINLSDGMGYLDEQHKDETIGRYMREGKVKWIDALVFHPHWMTEINECISHDINHIRVQEIIAVQGTTF